MVYCSDKVISNFGSTVVNDLKFCAVRSIVNSLDLDDDLTTGIRVHVLHLYLAVLYNWKKHGGAPYKTHKLTVTPN